MGVKVAEGGIVVSVGVFVFVGVFEGVAVRVAVEVAVGVNVEVNVSVCVAVCVVVGVKVEGRNGVFVIVEVGVMDGVNEAVLVNILGVRLPVGVKMLKVPVAVAVRGVFVGVGALGSGANWTAIQPRQ